MMHKLEVFFDYACPYCLKGYDYLLELLPLYPEVEIIWRPCEAHPRPDKHGLHSDLCARGMYFALENGADVMKYHDTMFRAALKNRVDIEDLHVVSKLTSNLLNADVFYSELSGGAYVDQLVENNNLAWNIYRFPAVPSFCMNGQLLKSIQNIGVNKELLATFIGQNLEKKGL